MILVGDELVYIGPDGRHHSLILVGPDTNIGPLTTLTRSLFVTEEGTHVSISDSVWSQAIMDNEARKVRRKRVRKAKKPSRKR